MPSGRRGCRARWRCPRPRCGSTSRSAPRATPTRPPTSSSAAPLSYAELQRQAEALAGWLQARGVQAGDRVLLFLQNCPQYVVAFYAVQRANAVVVPVNPMNRADEFGHYITDPRREAGHHQRRPGRHRRTRPTARLPEAQRLQHVLVTRFADTHARRRIDPAEAPAAGGAGLAAGRPGAARRRTSAGPTRWRPATRRARTPRSPTTWRCCPTPRAPPACPRAACTRTAR